MSGTLILLVPLLVLAAVLLFAFAGCTLIAGLDDHYEVVATYTQEVTKTAGLVAYWRLGDASPPDALDEGPSKLTGGYHGGVKLRDVDGALAKKEAGDKAPTFNGQDGYVEVGWKPPLNMPLSFSVEAWIRPAALGPGVEPVQEVVAFRDVVGAVYRGFELTVTRPPDPKPRIQGRVGTGSTTPPIAVEVVFELPDALIGGPGNDWKHVVLTYDGTAGGRSAKLYVDGDLKDTIAPVGYAPNVNQPLRIGAGRAQAQPTPADFFAGAIDEVAVYNVALDANAVKTHFTLSGR